MILVRPAPGYVVPQGRFEVCGILDWVQKGALRCGTPGLLGRTAGQRGNHLRSACVSNNARGMRATSLEPKEGNDANPMEPIPESDSRHSDRHVDVSFGDCIGRGKVVRPYAYRERSGDAPRLYGRRVHPRLARVG